MGRDSSVCLATRSGLDGPKIESRWRRDYPHPSSLALGAHTACSRAWPWPPTQSSDEVKERVELHLYSPSRPSSPVLRWTLPLHLPLSLPFRIMQNYKLCQSEGKVYELRSGLLRHCVCLWHFASTELVNFSGLVTNICRHPHLQPAPCILNVARL